jgi:enamine deaminase RidA (YjgF/YER057c/UK114 family)
MVRSRGSQPPNAERRLRELGIELALPPTPFGAYVEAVQTGNLLFPSGMLPAIGHEPKFIGRLGKEPDANASREAVRITALNVLSAAKQKLRSLNKVTHVVRLCVYLATDGDFFDQPKVADAASERLWRTQNRSPYSVRRGKSSSGHARGRLRSSWKSRHEVGHKKTWRPPNDWIPLTWFSGRQQPGPAALRPFAIWNRDCIPSWPWRVPRSFSRGPSDTPRHRR